MSKYVYTCETETEMLFFFANGVEGLSQCFVEVNSILKIRREKKKQPADLAFSLLGAIHTFHMSWSLPAVMVLAERRPSPVRYLVKDPAWISQAPSPFSLH